MSRLTVGTPSLTAAAIGNLEGDERGGYTFALAAATAPDGPFGLGVLTLYEVKITLLLPSPSPSLSLSLATVCSGPVYFLPQTVAVLPGPRVAAAGPNGIEVYTCSAAGWAHCASVAPGSVISCLSVYPHSPHHLVAVAAVGMGVELWCDGPGGFDNPANLLREDRFEEALQVVTLAFGPGPRLFVGSWEGSHKVFCEEDGPAAAGWRWNIPPIAPPMARKGAVRVGENAGAMACWSPCGRFMAFTGPQPGHVAVVDSNTGGSLLELASATPVKGLVDLGGGCFGRLGLDGALEVHRWPEERALPHGRPVVHSNPALGLQVVASLPGGQVSPTLTVSGGAEQGEWSVVALCLSPFALSQAHYAATASRLAVATRSSLHIWERGADPSSLRLPEPAACVTLTDAATVALTATHLVVVPHGQTDAAVSKHGLALPAPCAVFELDKEVWACEAEFRSFEGGQWLARRVIGGDQKALFSVEGRAEAGEAMARGVFVDERGRLVVHLTTPEGTSAEVFGLREKVES